MRRPPGRKPGRDLAVAYRFPRIQLTNGGLGFSQLPLLLLDERGDRLGGQKGSRPFRGIRQCRQAPFRGRVQADRECFGHGCVHLCAG